MKLRSPFLISLAGFLGATLLSTLHATLRWKKEGIEYGWPEKEPRIIAFWHGQQLMMAWAYRPFRAEKKRSRAMFVLISEHADGRVAATIMRHLSIRSIAGSSTRGGIKALLMLVKKLREGNHVSITPDGPKGPARSCKPGVVKLAQHSGAPIYPLAVAYERAWVFKSWDSMVLPRPFSRAAMVMSAPRRVDATLSLEEFEEIRLEVESDMNRCEERAKALLRESYN